MNRVNRNGCCICIVLILMLINVPISIGRGIEQITNEDQEEYYQQFLWEASKEYNYRVPGIVVTNKGTIIAYCERRYGLDDRSAMDVIMKRSTDNGNSWSETYVIADGISKNITVDNICMVVGLDDKIHCLYTPGVGKARIDGWVAYIYSDDDGVSWSKPIDISEVTKPYDRGLLATGPGHGIVTKSGRIIVPIWYSLNTDVSNDGDAFPSVSCTLYSDDNGNTWMMGDAIMGTGEFINPNENSLVELSDGSIMMNMRSTSDNYLRAYSISKDGAAAWSTPQFDNQLPGPMCYGSLTRFGDSILFLLPDYNEKVPYSRNTMLLRISEDDAKIWDKTKILLYNYGGYGDINCDKNGTYVYAAQEYEKDRGTISIMFIRVNKQWLSVEEESSK